MEILYTDKEIAELAFDYGVKVDVMTEMLAAGFDPDGRDGPSMSLDLDGEAAYCPTCRYEHLDAPCLTDCSICGRNGHYWYQCPLTVSGTEREGKELTMQGNEYLKAGDRVRITDGPYKNKIVTVVKMASESPAVHVITDDSVNHWIDLDDVELA